MIYAYQQSTEIGFPRAPSDAPCSQPREEGSLSLAARVQATRCVSVFEEHEELATRRGLSEARSSSEYWKGTSGAI
jgi:hypothetical protein